MFIRTDRLFLRPPFPEDWRDVYRGIANESTVRMLARAPWPYTQDDARDYCSRARSPGEMGYAIVLPTAPGGPVIGQVGIERRADGGYECGYWIAEAYRGQGYAVEALSAALETARCLRVERVEAGHFLDNPASGRVLRKCGFVPTVACAMTASAGRGGESAPARRYAIDLAQDMPQAA